MTPPERLTLKSIGSDFLHDFTQAENGLWGTIVQLTIRPRLVLDTFLHKNRRQFSRPTRYLIFCLSIAAFQFIAVQWRYGVSVAEYNSTLEEGAEIDQGALEAFAEGFLMVREGNNSVSSKKIAAYASYFLAALIPIYAFLYYFLFPARGLNYAESLAGATYLHGHAILLISLASLPFLFFTDIADFAWAKSWIGTGVYVLLLVSIFRTFLTAKRDALWMVPKLLLAAVWVVAPFALLGMITVVVLSLVSSGLEPMRFGPIIGSVLFFLIVTLLMSKLLLAFRTRWPRWYILVPTALIVLGAYTLLAFSLIGE